MPVKQDNMDEWPENVVTLKNLFNSLTMEDRKVVKDIMSAVLVDQVTYFHKIDPNQGFNEFMKKFDSPSTSPLNEDDFKLYYLRNRLEVVKIGNYMILNV
ncbi:hypothetical protein LOK49_LG15G02285 [Camellia lanceoleosa]|uniref:Uncharacterized protein n=1 Tax=Camellia lanceoleosa TaxID=1840588 RepID=A0ACC0F688_9ERIC|nr:hypothetical protein LOK49_LG15G02285 [Camellia lanceoleosa]